MEFAHQNTAKHARSRSSGFAGAGKSLDIAMQNVQQIFGGAGFARVHSGVFAEDVEANLAVDNFHEKAIDSATACRDLLQDSGALVVVFEGAADGFDLAFDTVYAREQTAAFFSGMGHQKTSLDILYPV
jgi:hypothetical protein